MAKRSVVVKAMDQHEDELTRRKNVVGLGVVPADDAAAELAVGVYVLKKLPPTDLSAGEMIPKSLSVKVGGKTVSVPTRVIEQGEVEKEGDAIGRG